MTQFRQKFSCTSFVALLLLGAFPTLRATSVRNPKLKENAEISDGSRISVKGKGFSIVPPAGWEIHRDYPNLSLLLQIPFAEGLAYQRTIQVMTFKGERYIDDITRREFESVLIKKYSKVSQSIKGYRVRNHLLTKMGDGREGILYYTEFLLETRKMMQAHILVSSDRNSYLLTYTDIIEHFEGEESSMYLTKAWESMTSILLVGDAPIRFQKMFLLGLLIIAILVLLILFYLIRHTKAGKSYTDHTQSEHLSEEDLADVGEQEVSKVSAPSISKYQEGTEHSARSRMSGMESIPPGSMITGDEWSLEEGEQQAESAGSGDAEGYNSEDDPEEDVWK